MADKQQVLPRTGLPADVLIERMRFQIEREFATIRSKDKLNFEGRISAHYSALAPPTGGKYVQADLVRNSAPTELGAVGSKYVVFGFLCVATGDPGTWVELRIPTGN